MQKQIQHYNDFIETLLNAGFSMGGGNTEDIYSVVDWGWKQQPPYETPVCWHNGDPDTDPWEWRIRVLEERDDIAYAKVFFKKSGYITRQWAPYFLAVRRGNQTLEEEYQAGKISSYAKRIYSIFSDHECVPLHSIKELAGFGKEEKSQFERGLTELQMKMYLTMCGKQQKRSQSGEEYGWSSTVFCTTEHFWGEDVFKESEKISAEDAVSKIREQILTLNPGAELKKILKFIKG